MCRMIIEFHEGILYAKLTEADWKLFRKKLPEWQEAHMEQLNLEYIKLLSGPSLASDKFWELEKRIKKDKRSPGVIAEMSRSEMYDLILKLLLRKIIKLDDLQDTMKYLMGDRR